ncbi:MAG TPA: hypothetical protein VJ728_02725 [Candidatus Binataceae bacterium]|nr:hypothetical protein [Candidatus Binataceae bacterium]
MAASHVRHGMMMFTHLVLGALLVVGWLLPRHCVPLVLIFCVRSLPFSSRLLFCARRVLLVLVLR